MRASQIISMRGILGGCYPRPVKGRKTYPFARHNVPVGGVVQSNRTREGAPTTHLNWTSCVLARIGSLLSAHMKKINLKLRQRPLIDFHPTRYSSSRQTQSWPRHRVCNASARRRLVCGIFDRDLERSADKQFQQLPQLPTARYDYTPDDKQ